MSCWIGRVAVAGVIAAVPLEAPAAPTETASGRRSRFVGADGAPLPFRDDAEVLDFLETAPIVSDERAPGGINGARKVLLEQDGVRAHAIFRKIAEEDWIAKFPGGRFQPFFRDHYVNEVAAYSLSELLGLHTVPPTVLRRWRHHDGSLQLWIEGVLSEEEVEEREKEPLFRIKRSMQVSCMRMFDLLINNTDRNLGNFLTDVQGRIWYVDHTRTFSRVKELREPDWEKPVPRELWLRLKELPDAALEAALADYLPTGEIAAVLERRRLLLERIDARPGIADGRELFSLRYAQTPLAVAAEP